MPIGEYIDLFVKGIVAFFILVGWFIILYPLIRKSRKAWPFLLAIATLLSFSLLVIKEIMDEVTPIFDELVSYALGIFFGIAALFFLFNFKSKWLNALPKDDTFFQNYKIKRKTHLRHLLRAAILIEEQGKNFYDKLAEKVTDTNVKNLCRKLAGDEVTHKQLFQNILSHWLSLSIDSESLASFVQELKMRGVFLNPPSPDSTEEDMVKYAIEQEKKTADFYLSFEKAFPEAWKRMHIQNLVMEERIHANKLIASYPQFKYITV